MNLDALYLVKLIFGEYLCNFESNHVAVLLHVQLYLDANRVPVREKVKGEITGHITKLIWPELSRKLELIV